MSLPATFRKWFDGIRSPPAGGAALGPRVLRFLIGMFCFRIVLAAVIPISGDEAYFVEWARHLDWCYYDHPGMVAWIMKPFLVLFGESILSVRAQAILAGIVFCVVAHRLASRMYPGLQSGTGGAGRKLPGTRVAEGQAPSAARPRRVRFGSGPDAARPALSGVAEGQAPSAARPALSRVAEGQAPSAARPALSSVAERSVFLAGLLPIVAVGSVIVSTDTPLNVFWALALLTFHEATERGRMRDWALTGVLVGSAFLSKFLAFGFLPAAFLYLVIPKENRRHLKTPGPWVAVAICAALFLPVILWNHAHDWTTFKFNFVRRQQGLSFSPGTFVNYAVLQMLVFSPVVLVVCAFHAFKGLRKHLENRNDLFLLLFAGVPLGGFALLSFLRRIGAHWTAIAIVPLAVFFARVTDRVASCKTAHSNGALVGAGPLEAGCLTERTRSGEEKSRTYLAGLATAGAFSFAAVLLAAFVLFAGPRLLSRTLVAAGVREDRAVKTAADVYGLKTIAEKAEELNRDEDAFFASDSYALSSLLTYHSPAKNHYHAWGATGYHGGNHELWDDFASLKGRTMMYVVRVRGMGERSVRKMLPHFESLVIHRFNRKDGADLVLRFGSRNVESVIHDAPFECGPFVIIEGKGFSE